MRSGTVDLPFLLVGALVVCSQAQIHFVETGVAAGLAATTGESNGAAFGDADADGWPDLLVLRTSRNDPASLYRNQMDGTFDAGAFAWTAPQDAVGGLFVDYDEDGDQDLYLILHQSPNQLQRNDAGEFSVVAQPQSLIWEMAHFWIRRQPSGSPTPPVPAPCLWVTSTTMAIRMST